MHWGEHVRRGLYTSHLGDCESHSLMPAPLVESEPMLRLNCQWCNGSVWVPWWPSKSQGADPDDLIGYTEKLVNDLGKGPEQGTG